MNVGDVLTLEQFATFETELFECDVIGHVGDEPVPTIQVEDGVSACVSCLIAHNEKHQGARKKEDCAHEGMVKYCPHCGMSKGDQRRDTAAFWARWEDEHPGMDAPHDYGLD